MATGIDALSRYLALHFAIAGDEGATLCTLDCGLAEGGLRLGVNMLMP